MQRLVIGYLALGLTVACSGSTGDPTDSSVTDGFVDSGVPDGLVPDGGVVDASDGSMPDGSTPSSEESAFGVFASFAPEFGDYERAAGISHPQYLEWAGAQHMALGAHWTRSNLQLIWDRIEPTIGGGYDWFNALGTEDSFGAASAADVHYLAVFHGGGVLHSDLRDQLEDVEAYQRFVQDVVERYDGDGVDDAPGGIVITHWQVGNETPQLANRADGADVYVEWFTATAEAVLRADARAKMVLVASTDSTSIDSVHADVMPRLIAAGVRFDVVDIHHWGTADDIEMRAVPDYRALLDSLGLGDVELWSTEHGTYVGEITPASPTCTPGCRASEICVQVGPMTRCVPQCTSDDTCPSSAKPLCDISTGRCGAPAQSLEDQARSLVKRYVVNRDLGVRLILWNNLVAWNAFGGNPGGIYDRIGLVSGGFLEFETAADRGQPRPSWFAFQRLAARTDELWAERLGPVTLGGDAAVVSAYRNRETGTVGWVAWARSDSATIERDVVGAGVRVTSFITDGAGTPNRDETVTASGGSASVVLDTDPVWIEPLP